MIRVLLVDGRNADRGILRIELANQGCDVTEAHNAREALATAQTDHPDIMLACVDGIEQDLLLFSLKSDTRLQRIPLVIRGEPSSLAASPRPAVMRANAVLAATADVSSIMACLREVLEQSAQHRAETRVSSPPRVNGDTETYPSETRLRLATEAANIGLWDWNVLSDDLYFSPIYKSQIGYEDHELPNRFEEWRSRVHPEDIDRVVKVFADYVSTSRTSNEVVFRFRHKNGSYRWILSRSSMITDTNGQLVRMLGAHVDITARKQAEDALRDSEAKFNAAFHMNPAALLIMGPDGAYVDVNEAHGKLSGYSREELIGRTPAEVGIASQEDVDKMLIEFRKHGSVRDFETNIRARDGSVRHVLTYVTTVLLSDEPHRLSVALDITERKRIEAALQDSESKFLAAFKDNPAALTLIGPEGNFVEVNQAFCDLAGYTREEVLGKTVRDVPTLTAADQHRLYFDPANANHTFIGTELQYQTRDGRVRYVIASSTPILLNGVPHRINTGVDITERKLAEERVRRLNRTYSVLSDINQLIVREHDPQKMLACACEIAVGKGGFALAWIGTRPAGGTIEVKAHAAVRPEQQQSIELAQDWRFECEWADRVLTTGQHEVLNDMETESKAESIRTAALRRGYQSIAAFPLIVHGQPFGTFNLYSSQKDFFDAEELHLLDELARDIAFALEVYDREHERQLALQRLQESEERFRELAETIEDVFWVSDGRMRQLYYLSPAFEKVWQRPSEPVYGDPFAWIDTLHPDDKDRVLQAFRSASSGNRVEVDYRIVRGDGALRWIRTRIFPLRNSTGVTDRIVGVARDVTESRTLEQQLAHSQKMQAIGTLAGGIAHDFNNLLAAILGNAELVRLDLPESSGTRESVNEIVRAGQRARQLVQRILTFSRPQEQQLKVVRLQAVVEEAVRLLRSTLPAGVQIQVRCEHALPTVRADESQIHQIIVNIVTNAWHAMKSHSGRVEITLTAENVDAAFCQLHPELHPGPHVRLAVNDTGQGMDEETLGRIFDPFFTTKPSGQGAGLGLSVVHGIVRAHEGVITVDSHVGRGTTFHIYLPASTEQVDAVADRSAEQGNVSGQGERILYLDDEESLVYLAVRFLTRMGYRVEGYTRAEEALAAFRSDPSSFDLVITDFNMPEMSGLEVTRRLLEIDRDAPVVLASGYVRPADVEEANALGIQEVFLKPNTIDEFGAVVQRLLSQRHRSRRLPH